MTPQWQKGVHESIFYKMNASRYSYTLFIVVCAAFAEVIECQGEYTYPVDEHVREHERSNEYIAHYLVWQFE